MSLEDDTTQLEQSISSLQADMYTLEGEFQQLRSMMIERGLKLESIPNYDLLMRMLREEQQRREMTMEDPNMSRDSHEIGSPLSTNRQLDLDMNKDMNTTKRTRAKAN